MTTRERLFELFEVDADRGILRWRKPHGREATFAQNSQNRHTHKKSSSFPRGVSQNAGKRFKAKIICNRKIIHLGYFDTAEAAGEAYQAKRKDLFGEFA